MLVLLCVMGAGCYTYQPVVGRAAPGQRVTVDFNDRGRSALADSLGGFVDHLEGSVQTATDSLLVVRVLSVKFLNGESSQWTEEPVGILREYIQGVQVRRFSRGRTMFASAGVVGALVAFIASRTLLGGGHVPSGPPPPPPLGQ